VPLLNSVSFVRAMATTVIYTLSLHDALPISERAPHAQQVDLDDLLERLRIDRPDKSRAGDARVGHHDVDAAPLLDDLGDRGLQRSEEHTSELQSRENLVCRLLLEKKNSREGG